MLNVTMSFAFLLSGTPPTSSTYPSPSNLVLLNVSLAAFTGLNSFLHLSVSSSCCFALSRSFPFARRNFWRMSLVWNGFDLLSWMP
jgi:hypothetical protein